MFGGEAWAGEATTALERGVAILESEIKDADTSKISVTAKVARAKLVAKADAAKEAKDWAVADELRDAVAAAGYTIKDVKGGEPAVSKL